MKICPNCHYFDEKEEKFCPLCGCELLSKCPKCGQSIHNPLSRYCTDCGYRFERAVIAGDVNKRR